MTHIHPTAIIEEGAQIGDNATIGPYVYITKEVKIGDNAHIYSHVVVDGDTTIGNNVMIFPFASVGVIPQDLKFGGEKTRTQIGNNCRIREHVTIHAGTEGGGGLTKIGDNCLLMVGAHVAHDCIIGNHVILVNSATIAGHVEIGDFSIVGGLSAVHQFVKIGNNVMIGGMSGVEKDVIPFGMVFGERASLQGLNIVGMKRAKFKRNDMSEIRKVYDQLFKEDGLLKDKVAQVDSDNPFIEQIMEFINQSDRGILQPNDEK